MVLDEWQRLPEVRDRVRRAVDRDLTPGRLILTGSASPTSSSVHTGASRIATLRMRPLSLVERGQEEPTVSLASLLAGEGGRGGPRDGPYPAPQYLLAGPYAPGLAACLRRRSVHPHRL